MSGSFAKFCSLLASKSFALVKDLEDEILASNNGERIGGQTKPKAMKKSRLIEELEEIGLIDKNASVGAKHSKLKGLLNSISIAGSDNPLVEVI
jgi:hypothetical protein